MVQSRPERLAAFVMEEVSEILRREVKDPRIGFVTVTDVEASNDLRYVKVYVSVLGSDEERDRTMEGLASATGFVRSEMGKRLNLRHTPEITFRFDKSIQRGARVHELLLEVKKGDGRAR